MYVKMAPKMRAMAICLIFIIVTSSSDARIMRKRQNLDPIETTTTTAVATTTTTTSNFTQIIDLLGPRKAVDLVFILSRAKTIWKRTFYEKSRYIMRSLVQLYSTVHANYTRLAVVSYAATHTVDFDDITGNGSSLDKCQLFPTDEGASQPLDVVMYREGDETGNCGIYAAYREAERIITAGKEKRPDATQVAVLLSDAMTPCAPESIALKSLSDVRVFGVSLGAFKNLSAMAPFVSDPWTSFAADMDQWMDITERVKAIPRAPTPLYAETSGNLSCGKTADSKCYCNIDDGIVKDCQSESSCDKPADIKNCANSGGCKEGKCLDVPYGFICYCRENFYGLQCQNYSDPCRFKDICDAKFGVCVGNSEGGGQFRCNCTQGFEGDFCQDLKPTTAATTTTTTTAAATTTIPSSTLTSKKVKCTTEKTTTPLLEVTSLPQKATTFLVDGTSSPQHATATHQGITSQPQVVTSVLQDATSSPQRITATSNDVTTPTQKKQTVSNDDTSTLLQSVTEVSPQSFRTSPQNSTGPDDNIDATPVTPLTPVPYDASRPIIIGSVVGAIVLLAVIFGLALCLACFLRSKRPSSSAAQSDYLEQESSKPSSLAAENQTARATWSSRYNTVSSRLSQIFSNGDKPFGDGMSNVPSQFSRSLSTLDMQNVSHEETMFENELIHDNRLALERLKTRLEKLVSNGYAEKAAAANMTTGGEISSTELWTPDRKELTDIWNSFAGEGQIEAAIQGSNYRLQRTDADYMVGTADAAFPATFACLGRTAGFLAVAVGSAKGESPTEEEVNGCLAEIKSVVEQINSEGF